MEKNRICKICNRRFSNGKAMGGHMRSHLAKLPLPPKPIQTYNSTPKSTSSSSSLNYPLSTDQKAMQANRSMVNRDDVPFVSTKPNLYYGETSETESLRNPTRRRSKRSRYESEKKALEANKAISVKVASDYSSEQVSSVTDHDILAEEDVALCLLMLSRDKWVKLDVKEVVKTEAFDEYIEEEEEEGVNFSINHVKGKRHAEDQDEEEEEHHWLRVSSTSHDAKYSKSNKYRCKICKKGFKSYQALGGHKASHKKIKVSFKEEEYWEDYGDNINNSIKEQRIFECPFCDKVFESGQALGGHKKVHFSYLPPMISSASKPNTIGRSLLDLNLPAPEASTLDVEVG